MDITAHCDNVFPAPAWISCSFLCPSHLIKLSLEIVIQKTLGKGMVSLIGIHSYMASCYLYPHNKSCGAFTILRFHGKKLVFQLLAGKPKNFLHSFSELSPVVQISPLQLLPPCWSNDEGAKVKNGFGPAVQQHVLFIEALIQWQKCPLGSLPEWCKILLLR